MASHELKVIFVAAAMLVYFAPTARAQESLQTHYAPPEAMPDATNRLSAIAAELDNPSDAPSVADAATRFDAVLHDSAQGMIVNADGSETSVRCWTRALANNRRETLSKAMELLEGASAQQAMDDLRAKPFADPIEFYSIAQRYPLSAIGTDALRAAAGQSEALGDKFAAKALNEIAAGKMPPSPDTVGDELPVAMSWFGLPGRTAWAATRTAPVSVGGMTFIAGPTQVLAMSGDSTVLWRGPTSAADAEKRGVSDPNGSTRGPTYRPAFFTPDHQPPAVVVVRQPTPRDAGWAIRALRGSDGQLLWTSENNSELTHLVFGSNPAVVGRYVYAVAGEFGDDLDRMTLIAMELTTGNVLWRCDIGSVSHPSIVPRHLRPGVTYVPDRYRPWLNQSAPAVTGDAVVFAPNIGAVVAVDRFDGTLRWVHPYLTVGMPSVDPNASALAARAAQLAALRDHSGQAATLPIRWNNAPVIAGERVIVAPQDSVSVDAYDVRDGRLLWENSQIPLLNPGRLESPVETPRSFTLLGVQHDKVVLQGASLIGLSLADGSIAARTDSISGIGGPGVLRGDRILLPTKDRGVMECAEVSDVHPSSVKKFNDLINTPSLRKALGEMGVVDCFAVMK